MTKRELLINEIDKMKEKDLEFVYRFITNFNKGVSRKIYLKKSKTNWKQFLDETFGSLKKSPIKREDIKSYEKRAKLL